MKPGKILFLLTITITILFTNINIVDAEQYTYTFKSGDWTLKKIEKYSNICRKTLGESSSKNGKIGAGTCTFYYTETFKATESCLVCDETKPGVGCTHYKTKKNCSAKDVGKKTVNGTAIFDPSHKESRKDVIYVKKATDISKLGTVLGGGETSTIKWSKMVIDFGQSKGRLGLAYDEINKIDGGCKKVKTEPLKSICSDGSKVTDAEKYNYAYKDESKIVSEAEAKKILKSEMKSTNCKELLGDDLVEILQSLVDIVKVAVPILLIALGTLDFGKAIFSSDDNEMKKAQSKFMKRLLAAAAIFLVPSLLGVLLNLGHSIWGDVIKTDLCGIKF